MTLIHIVPSGCLDADSTSDGAATTYQASDKGEYDDPSDHNKTHEAGQGSVLVWVSLTQGLEFIRVKSIISYKHQVDRVDGEYGSKSNVDSISKRSHSD